jgi:cardiolipin synthase
VLARDVGIVVTVTVVNMAVGRRTFRPSIYGKAATATYIVTVVAVLFFNYVGRRSVLVDIGVWTSLAITLVSGLHYVAYARRLINEPPASA